MDPIPQQIAGRYRVVELLGRGGMGEVYRVVDETTGATVALKRLTEDGSRAGPGHGDQAALFEREYHTLAQLAHPRVIVVHDYGLDGGRPYYTMECLDGQDLRALAPLPWTRACELLLDVCSSLGVLHSRGLVHRDLSPRNVRCTGDGRAKLIDFGALASMGQAGGIVGTPAYMAPEVVHGQLLDARADLFSLGALAYWMLTGRHAYPVKHVRHLRDAWRSPPPRPSQAVSDVPDALDRLVMSLMRMDPLARPGTTTEVVVRLASILGRESVDGEAANAYLTSPALIARDEAQLSFRKRVLRAVRGGGGSILVEGERGMGRSRLLATYVLEAKLAGALVLRGAGTPHDTEPYALVRALVAELELAAPDLARGATRAQAKYLAHVLPDQYPADADTIVGSVEFPNPAIQETLLDWFTALSRQLCLCIAVDDLPRADAASAALLARLADRAHDERLVIAVTRRAGDGGGAARAVEQIARSGARLLLRPLDADGTLKLTRSVFGDVPRVEAAAQWLHRLARGNPGVCLELAQHLVDRGGARFVQGAWVLPQSFGGDDLPSSFEQALRERLDAVSAPARYLIELMSLVSPHAPLGLGDYVKMLERRFDHETIFQAFDELAMVHILVRAGEGYAVRDEALVRSIARALDDAQLRELHGVLAEYYAGKSDVGMLIATHHEFHAGLTQRAFERYAATRGSIDDISSTNAIFGRSRDGIVLLEAMYARAVEVGRPPAELQEQRKVLLQIAAVEEPALERYAGDAVAQLWRDTGLQYWDEYPDLAPLERIGRCLEVALQVHEAAPDSERGLHPLEAVRELAVTSSLLTGITARTVDTAAMARLPGLIAPLVPLSPVVKLLAELTQVAVDSVVRGADVMTRRAAVVEQLTTPVEGMDELTRQGAYNLMSYYLGLEEAVNTDPVALSRADALERHPNYASLAWQVRLLYHQYRGDAKSAERCRNQRELLALQHVESDQHLTRSLIQELRVHVIAADLLALKHTTSRLEHEARSYPGWKPWWHYAQAAVHIVQNDRARAEEALDRCLSSVGPLEHQVWPAARAMQAQLAVAGGAAQAAVEVVDETLEVYKRENLVPNAHAELICARAHGQALLGDADAGARALEELIDQALGRGREGLYVGHLLELRARLALLVADARGFEHFASRAANELKRMRNPVLVAKFERLVSEARRSRRDLTGELAESALVSQAFTTGHGSVATSVHTVLGACRGPQERASRAVELLVTESGAGGGYLFGVADDQLSLLASRHVPPPDVALLEVVEDFYRSTLVDDEEEEETRTESDEIERTQALGIPGSNVLGSLYPYVLHTYSDGRHVVVGVAVLVGLGDEPPALHWEVLTGVTHALMQAGDILGVS